jgi:four helix bundle protein
MEESAHLTLNVFKAADQQTMRDSFLSAQLRRTGVVISTRITEGCTKENNVEFARCLHRSRASCYELEYLILLARDLQYLAIEAHDGLFNQLVEVRKMLSGLLRTL